MEIVLFNENRWKVVDENGKTLDDAQGYGFTSKAAARRCWNYKQTYGKNKNSAKEFKRKIANWWYEHKDLYDYVVDEIWINMKDCTPLKDAEIIKITKNYIQAHSIEKPKGLHTWLLVKYMKF